MFSAEPSPGEEESAPRKNTDEKGVACKIIMDRIAPAPKGRPIRFNLPDARNAEDVAAALGAVVGAMANGELTPDEAQVVANVLEIRRRAIETVELENRLRVVESMNDGDRQF
jgi:hypothetical protein